MPGRQRRQTSDFPVPGGFVTTEIRGGIWFAFSLLRSLTPNIFGAVQDVVVLDDTRTRQLYREGPYNGSDVGQAASRVRLDIERMGLEDFLRRKQIQNAQIGSVEAPANRPVFFILDPLVGYLRAFINTRLRRKRVR